MQTSVSAEFYWNTCPFTYAYGCFLDTQRSTDVTEAWVGRKVDSI